MSNLPANTEIFYTADGSPTLNFTRSDGYREKMHHSAGAVGESMFIYLEALRAQMRLGEPSGVLSVGLGLGYNELLTLAEFKKKGIAAFKIWSFEALDDLRVGFARWTRAELTGDFGTVLDQAAAAVAKAMDISANDLRKFAQESIDAGQLELRGPFPDNAADIEANVIYYDAYSKKMDESLWSEDAFVTTLTRIAAADCVLATYAATGNLNRALRRLGFRLSEKTGFMGKRESTMAFRGRLI